MRIFFSWRNFSWYFLYPLYCTRFEMTSLVERYTQTRLLLPSSFPFLSLFFIIYAFLWWSWGWSGPAEGTGSSVDSTEEMLKIGDWKYGVYGSFIYFSVLLLKFFLRNKSICLYNNLYFPIRKWISVNVLIACEIVEEVEGARRDLPFLCMREMGVFDCNIPRMSISSFRLYSMVFFVFENDYSIAN